MPSTLLSSTAATSNVALLCPSSSVTVAGRVASLTSSLVSVTVKIPPRIAPRHRGRCRRSTSPLSRGLQNERHIIIEACRLRNIPQDHRTLLSSTAAHHHRSTDSVRSALVSTCGYPAAAASEMVTSSSATLSPCRGYVCVPLRDRRPPQCRPWHCSLRQAA